MLTELEKKVVQALQGDIPVVKRPFEALAEKIGITEDRFLEIMNDLKNRGIIRRFGATLKHQKSGFTANAMVAWQVAEEKVPETGRKMAMFDEVTHCYRRDPVPGWQYNLYTMVHASDEAACREIVQKISRKVNAAEYTILFSRKELKKTSMKYFSD